jgi:hypothetical protein
MSEWISVITKLPQEYERVLVYRANYEGENCQKTHVGFFNPKDGFYGSQYGLLDDNLYSHTLVTHWQPLPEAPKD